MSYKINNYKFCYINNHNLYIYTSKPSANRISVLSPWAIGFLLSNIYSSEPKRLNKPFATVICEPAYFRSSVSFLVSISKREEYLMI